MDISCLFSHLSVDGYLGYFHSFGLPCGSTGKESACNVGDLGSIPGLGRSTGEGKAIHSSILAWRIPWTKSMGSQRFVHNWVTFTFTFILWLLLILLLWTPACKILCGHVFLFLLGIFLKVELLGHTRPGFNPWVGKIPWRKKWQSTPVLLPGKSHGQRSLVGYSPWGRK